jgi:hypothetical protein
MRLHSVRVVHEEGQLYLFFVRAATYSASQARQRSTSGDPSGEPDGGSATTDASRPREQR